MREGVFLTRPVSKHHATAVTSELLPPPSETPQISRTSTLRMLRLFNSPLCLSSCCSCLPVVGQ
ncbi:hypothetical protein INR49_022588 [Caranx melampygus]|nr:hypothetical protein INR49_022588 [Caranx melampygus]